MYTNYDKALFREGGEKMENCSCLLTGIFQVYTSLHHKDENWRSLSLSAKNPQELSTSLLHSLSRNVKKPSLF